MLGGIAGVAHQRERPHIAGAGAGDDLAPVGVVGLGELREQPHQRAVSRILHLIGQLDAVGFLPAAEKNLCAADDVTKEFPYAVPGNFLVGFDRLSSFDGFRSAGRAMCIQCFLCSYVGRNRLLQFLVVVARQVSKKHGAVDTGGSGIIQYRLYVFAPAVPHPQCDLIAAGGGPC